MAWPITLFAWGLSPLARGNPAQLLAWPTSAGPIPARAGQPWVTRYSGKGKRAYPRSRGATAGVAASNASSKGLSPLARGNRTTGTVRGGGKGPIPARAGQPEVPGIKSPSLTAYPRSRGATSNRWRCRNSPSGLSPLARGNLPRRVNRRIHHGPIPARAGQPAAAAAPRHPKRAYPRSRGATRNTPCTQSSCRGLSPLARGNRHQVLNIRRWQGPIPARAGQPSRCAASGPDLGAYPRSRGATWARADQMALILGLSPLARGNPLLIWHAALFPGPIPARAGQPAFMARISSVSRAYPRSRGATSKRWRCRNSPSGLSPLARGNHAPSRSAHRPAGPIPARAGQPTACRTTQPPSGAYPRSRGATFPATR